MAETCRCPRCKHEQPITFFPLLTRGIQKGEKRTENCGTCMEKRKAEKKAAAKKAQVGEEEHAGCSRETPSEQPAQWKREMLPSCLLSKFLTVLSERQNVVELEACVDISSWTSAETEDQNTRHGRADVVAVSIGEVMMYHWTYVALR